MEIKAYSILTCVCRMRSSAAEHDFLLSEAEKKMHDEYILFANESFINPSFHRCIYHLINFSQRENNW